MITKPTEIKGKGICLKNIREVARGSISLSFDIEIEVMGMTIKECLLIKNLKDNIHFLTFPSREYEKDGVKKRMSYIWMEPERKKKLETMLIDLIKEYYTLA